MFIGSCECALYCSVLWEVDWVDKEVGKRLTGVDWQVL